MTSKDCETQGQGYAVTERMNDYVGPGTYARVTWVSMCKDGGHHLLGKLGYTCVKCNQSPQIEWQR